MSDSSVKDTAAPRVNRERKPKIKQLYTPLAELTLFGHYDQGVTHTKDGSGLPFVSWPNGAPCLVANMFMLVLRNRPGRNGRFGLARRGGKGGTIGDYAAKISPLIRFAFYNNVDFIRLNDGLFTQFMDELSGERSKHNPLLKARSDENLLGIGRACLDFLGYVGRLHGQPNFVAEEGTIRVEEKEFSYIDKRGRRVKKSYLTHHSLPISKGRTHRRSPIPQEDVKKLRAAVNSIGSSRFLQLRRNLMLSLYEHTGARRGEISRIKVQDIKNALAMKHPMLRLTTLKAGAEDDRMIPIHRAVLSEANRFMEMQRAKVMRKNKVKRDHGMLFVHEITGKPLGDYSLTGEIRTLRLQAGIERQTCGHMFRHAFITNLFVLLIKRHKFRHKDDFRSALLHGTKFIQDVKMWTGQKSDEAVEHYLNLAFARIDGYEETVASVDMIRVNRAYDQAEEALLEELRNGLSPDEFIARQTELKRQRGLDLNRHAATEDPLEEMEKTFFGDEE